MNDFYRIIGENKSEEAIAGGMLKHLSFRIGLNGTHPVFGGHFPGNPVVPGVCQVEMIRELVEKEAGYELLLDNADNIKFLSAISPVVFPEVDVKLDVKDKSGERKDVSGTIFYNEIIFLKFRGTFKMH